MQKSKLKCKLKGSLVQAGVNGKNVFISFFLRAYFQ
jgi:hypothetical protein